MGGGCGHRDLEFLGRQKTEEGYNEYFRCRGCGAVIVITPGKQVYKIGGSD